MVAVGLMLVDPFAEVELKLPGVMVIPVALEVVHASVLFAPASTLVGFAANEAMAGVEPFPEVMLDAAPQFSNPVQNNSTRASAKTFSHEGLKLHSFALSRRFLLSFASSFFASRR